MEQAGDILRPVVFWRGLGKCDVWDLHAKPKKPESTTTWLEYYQWSCRMMRTISQIETHEENSRKRIVWCISSEVEMRGEQCKRRSSDNYARTIPKLINNQPKSYAKSLEIVLTCVMLRADIFKAAFDESGIDDSTRVIKMRRDLIATLYISA